MRLCTIKDCDNESKYQVETRNIDGSVDVFYFCQKHTFQVFEEGEEGHLDSVRNASIVEVS